MNTSLHKESEKSTSAAPILDGVRAAAVRRFPISNIQNLTRHEVVSFMTSFSLGQWGTFVFPRDWFAPGVSSIPSARRIDIRGKIESLRSAEEDLDSVILGISRYVILCFCSKVSSRSPDYLAPSTVCAIGHYAVRLAIISLAGGLRNVEADNIFRRLKLPTVPVTLVVEYNRMIRLKDLGLWDDAPDKPNASPEAALYRDDDNASGNTEGNGKDDSKPFLPFNDKFVAAAGYRAAWMIEILGPSLVRCVAGLSKICQKYPLNEGNYKTQAWHRNEKSKKFLSEFQWTAPDGSTIREIPFSMDFKGIGGGATFSWPIRHLSTGRSLARLLQAAHLFVVMLSIGGRISEILSLQPGCVQLATDGVSLAHGRTYKLSFKVGGVERDWPLPDLAIFALRQQEALADLTQNDDSEGGEPGKEIESIWTREGGAGERIDSDYNSYLEKIVSMFGLEKELAAETCMRIALGRRLRASLLLQ